MLTEALVAIAAASGSAVVQAASTDAWTSFRQRIARILGRGDTQRERAELERLDRTAAALGEAPEGEAARIRDRQEGTWQARFETLLEGLDEPEQQEAVDQLQALLAEYSTPASSASAATGGLAAGRDVRISGGQGGIAAGIINGGAHIGTPHKPDSSQG
ncbi:hypothetical protein [Streptomyces sp. NBC_01244]|uniref:hypothetical protein n=1 Tax=Streptomyces sp. NBC_01244 TaxID=2903797 RepID=UPI002E14A174|nr:hypothetical protein OG247_41745 [Streptomyces sp. NBC_01244]